MNTRSGNFKYSGFRQCHSAFSRIAQSLLFFFLSAVIAEISLFNFIVPLRLLHGKVG